MKEIRIGSMFLNKKAILTIAFCLFLNGIMFGGLIAAFEDKEESNFAFLSLLIIELLLPYILFYKTIKQNITKI